MMKYINKSLAILVMLLLMNACSSSWLDVNTDPNSPASADLALLMPAAQTSLGFRLSRTVNENSSIFARQYYNLSESQYNHDPSEYSNDWDGLYSNALEDFELIIQQATEEERWHYVGIAKICKAYAFMEMVDLWGDLPFTEALNGGEAVFSPHFDNDETIYNSLFTLIDEGLAELAKDDLSVDNDLIYHGDIDLWIKAANTIKMRINLSFGDGAAMQNIYENEEIIADMDEDFQFLYNSSESPLNRHPVYQQEYAGAGSKTFYMSNYFMYYLILKNDPRLPYYVYRQSDGSGLNFQTTPCSQRTDCIYGYLGDNPDLPSGAGDGYIGRDHGDPSGIPGDQRIRATFGVYPIGGSYDDGEMEERTVKEGANGAKGAGILPMLTSYMVDFMMAEAIVNDDFTSNAYGGDVAMARDFLEAGIRGSMAAVESFSLSATGSNSEPMDDADVDAYVTARLADYDAATNNVQRTNLIITEKYFSVFGNGMEAYYDYRRTGFPLNLPPALAPTAPFPVRLHYSLTELNTNANAPSPPPPVGTARIFWDKD